MIPGSKAHAFHACMKKHGFMTRKIRASSHFLEKNARIASILGLRKHIVRSNPCIIHPVILSPLSCSAHILLLFPSSTCSGRPSFLPQPESNTAIIINTPVNPNFFMGYRAHPSHRFFPVLQITKTFFSLYYLFPAFAIPSAVQSVLINNFGLP